MATVTAIPVAEYLQKAYRPDCDYLEGELLERNVGEWDHSRLQMLLSRELSNHEKEWRILVVPEQRVQVKPERFRIPDISVLTSAPKTGIVTEPPLLCIEILSPRDSVTEMQERIDDYLEFGVSTVWLINPRTRRAHVYTRDRIWEAKDGILRIENSPVTVALGELA